VTLSTNEIAEVKYSYTTHYLISCSLVFTCDCRKLNFHLGHTTAGSKQNKIVYYFNKSDFSCINVTSYIYEFQSEIYIFETREINKSYCPFVIRWTFH